MEIKEVLKVIQENGFIYLTFEKTVKNLMSVTDLTKEEASDYVKSLIEEGELMYDNNQRLFLTKLRGYIKCKICANKKGYAFAQILDNPTNRQDIFIPKDFINGALDEDIVLVRVSNSFGENEEGEVMSVLRRTNEYIVGEMKLISKKYYCVPDDEKFPMLRISSADRLGAVEGDKVVAKIIFEGDNEQLRGVVTECLGKSGTVAAEEMAIIRSFKIRDKFSEVVLKEASQIPEAVSEKEKKDRLDLTKLRTVTIDGEDSRDFDDAISVEKLENGYRLGVHIADVSHYVKKGSAIDDEAYLRGNSVYFPDIVIPMLPERLSNGICSLREGVERLTLSVIIDFDEDCKILKSKIANSVIKSNHRMTYTKVQKMLEGDTETIEQYKDIYDDIILYSEISRKLKKLRQARGEIRLDIPEPKVFENDLGEIDRIEKHIQDESHELIESLMIIANEVVAETFFAKKLPFVYRVHEKPETSRVEKLIDVCAGLGLHAKFDTENISTYDYQKLTEQIEDDPRKWTIMKIILRSMMKACYSDKCLGHFGIASTFYCHFTSPIRRYPDLLIHRIIKSYLSGKKSKELHLEYDAVVSTASEQSSLTEKRADEVERAVDDYKKALYMKKHMGEKYVGTISGVHEFGVFVELENTIEGLIRFEYLPVDSYEYNDRAQILKGDKHCYKLGDKLEVICVNANTRLRQIDFELAERLNNASIEEIIEMRNNTRSHYKKEEAKKPNKEKFEGKKPKNSYKVVGKKGKQKYSRKNIKIEY